MTSVPSFGYNLIVKTPDSGTVMLGDSELGACHPVLNQLEIYHQGNLGKVSALSTIKQKQMVIHSICKKCFRNEPF